MNILHISSNYYPEVGGLATSVPPLVKKLIARGHKSLVLTRDVKGYPSYEILDGIPVYRSTRVPGYFYHPPVAFAKSVLMGVKARKIINKENIEIIHSHDINVSAIAGIIGTKYKDVKKVTKLSGGLSWELLSLMKWKNQTLEEFYASGGFLIDILERIQRTICNQYDAVIAPSNYIKRILTKYGGADSSQIHVLYNGITVEPYSESHVSEIRRTLLSDSKYLVVNACRMVPWKGLDYLIEAFRILPEDIRLVLIGDGPVRNTIQSMAKGLNVVFLDKMPHSQVQSYIRACDVFVMPSLFENFPLAALDCLATQTPIIATNIGGTPEIITHNETGLLIKAGEVEAIADSVLRLLSDSELYAKIKTNQEERLKKYLWENLIDRYIKFYSEVLES